MNWRFYVDSREGRALEPCRARSPGGDLCGSGLGYGWSSGDGTGDGSQVGYADGLGSGWIPADESHFGEVEDGDGESADTWR